MQPGCIVSYTLGCMRLLEYMCFVLAVFPLKYGFIIVQLYVPTLSITNYELVHALYSCTDVGRFLPVLVGDYVSDQDEKWQTFLSNWSLSCTGDFYGWNSLSESSNWRAPFTFHLCLSTCQCNPQISLPNRHSSSYFKVKSICALLTYTQCYFNIGMDLYVVTGR